jgi:murein L,D-transpeptidase YafK
MIHHLCEGDPNLASTYDAQIDMILGFVELAVQDYKACILQQQQEAAKATQKEEEHQRLLVKEDV